MTFFTAGGAGQALGPRRNSLACKKSGFPAAPQAPQKKKKILKKRAPQAPASQRKKSAAGAASKGGGGKRNKKRWMPKFGSASWDTKAQTKLGCKDLPR